MSQRLEAFDLSPPARNAVRSASAVALTVGTLFMLAACGGGGGGGSTPPPPPPPPPAPATVTSTSVATTTIDQPAIVTVNGTGLSDSSIAVTSPGCTTLTRLTTAPNASTATVAYYQCALSAYSGTVTVAGSGTTLSTATFTLPVPAVTGTVVTSAGRYGGSVLLTIAGSALDDGLSVTSTGCKNITRQTSAPNISTATTAYYQCTSSGAYSSAFTLKTAVGTTLPTTATLTVPAPIVTMAFSGGGVSGNVVFNLKGDTAPITVDNFLAYVKAGFYNGLIVHRIAHPTSAPPYSIVQSGGYGAATSGTLPTPKAALYAPIALESTGGNNVQWTAAMARTSAPNSATSQFFFNLTDNTTAFGSNYAVFADVSSSASVLTQMTQASCTALIGTGLADGSCVPIPNVVITSATQTQ